jgi:hypothetical protein
MCPDISHNPDACGVWIPASSENSSSGGLLGVGWDYFVAQGFEDLAMVTGGAVGIELEEVIGPEVLVRLPGPQQVIDHLELRMGYGNHGTFLAAAARQTVELGPEVRILRTGRRPGGLAQGRLEPAVAFGGPATGLLAGASQE